MNRIPPSERIPQQIDALLKGNLADAEDLISQLLLFGAQRLAQEMLEQEISDYLGRDHYECRDENADQEGYRNVSRAINVDTAEGCIQLKVYQVRETLESYRSRIASFLRGNSDVLERLAVEMYTRGLSNRDIEDAFQEVTGDQLLSRTAVSHLTDQLWEDHQAVILISHSPIADKRPHWERCERPVFAT